MDLLWHLKFVQHVGDDVFELTITIAWSIWFNRNATRLEKSSQNASMIIQKARALLDEFQVANFQLSLPMVKDSGQWICLKPPWYKINTKAAVFEQQQATEVGAVIQDHEGQVVARLSKKLWYPLGPLEVEAKALEEAIEFAWEVGTHDAHFECDLLMVSNTVQELCCPPVVISKIVLACVLE